MKLFVSSIGPRQLLSATAAGAASWLTTRSMRGQQENHARKSAAERDNPGERDRSDSLPEATWNCKVPVRYEADVVVIGGGIAAVSAVAAAARSGASVILVERFAVTGGVLTSGGVSNFCDPSQVRRSLGEVFTRIISDLDASNAIGHGKSSVFHYETMAVILQELLLRRHVKLLLHTRFADRRRDHLAQNDVPITNQALCPMTLVFIFDPLRMES
ncbi:MAG: FAD-dependent oxidoreductase [Pirellulaceae bacterium]